MVHLLKSSFSCLIHGVQFRLGEISKPAGYVVDSGWNDYFEPVFPTEPGRWLRVLNRPHFLVDTVPLLRIATRAALRAIHGDCLFMFDEVGPLPERVELESLDIKADYWEAIRQFIEILWVYRADVAEGIGAHKDRTGLTSGDYVALHVRRGDKDTVSHLTEIGRYVESIHSAGCQGGVVYVATDDLRIVGDLVHALGPRFDVVTGEHGRREGYDQAEFNARSPNRRWRDTVFLMFELEMLKNSRWFFGSSTSNLFYWTRYRRGNVGITDVDHVG